MGRTRSTKQSAAVVCPLPESECCLASLSDLAAGTYARIVSLCDAEGRVCELGAGDETAIRMQHLGFVPGCLIRIVSNGMRNRGGIAVQANATRFGLNRAEASRVQTMPLVS